MMQDIPNPETELSLSALLRGNDHDEKPWKSPESESGLLAEIADDQVADSHPSTWRKYCDARLRQFRASR
jgi:hypothetical protein